jgi:2-methylcitrate dehydratase PrpD
LDGLLDIAALPASSLSADARRFATSSLFDWLVRSRAGADQDLSRIVRAYLEHEGGRPVATAVGESAKLPARAVSRSSATRP